MPLYDYSCEKCHEVLEIHHPMSGLVFGEKYHDRAYVVFTKNTRNKRENVLVHAGCGADMIRLISPVRGNTIGG